MLLSVLYSLNERKIMKTCKPCSRIWVINWNSAMFFIRKTSIKRNHAKKWIAIYVENSLFYGFSLCFWRFFLCLLEGLRTNWQPLYISMKITRFAWSEPNRSDSNRSSSRNIFSELCSLQKNAIEAFRRLKITKLLGIWKIKMWKIPIHRNSMKMKKMDGKNRDTKRSH